MKREMEMETLETLRNRYMEIAEWVVNGQMSAEKAKEAKRALDEKLGRINKALKEPARRMLRISKIPA
jgi:hypothetical protein